MGDPEMLGFAMSLGIEVVDVKQFFNILSQNGSIDLDLENFVIGCIRGRGAAKSLDLLELVRLQKENSDRQREYAYADRHFQEECFYYLSELGKTMGLPGLSATIPISNASGVRVDCDAQSEATHRTQHTVHTADAKPPCTDQVSRIAFVSAPQSAD